MAKINSIDCVAVKPVKCVRITYGRKTAMELHVADDTDKFRQVCLVQEFEEFIREFKETNWRQLDIDDVISFEVTEIPEAQLQQLKKYDPVR
jgi:hypothetical protein